jgi:structural maintenance of chromosome 1
VIEKMYADRNAIFRRCKLEEIELPFAKGSLDDIPVGEMEVRHYYSIVLIAVATN